MRGWPDEACEGRDFWPWDAEAGADEFVERQFQLHAGFGKPQHGVARVATLVADGPAGDFSFRDEGADVVFGGVGVDRNFRAFENAQPASGPLACVDLSMPEGLIGGRGGKCFSRASSSFTARCSTRSFANAPSSFSFSARIRVTSPIRSRTTPIRSACVKCSNESRGGSVTQSLNHTFKTVTPPVARKFAPVTMRRMLFGLLTF